RAPRWSRAPGGPAASRPFERYLDQRADGADALSGRGSALAVQQYAVDAEAFRTRYVVAVGVADHHRLLGRDGGQGERSPVDPGVRLAVADVRRVHDALKLRAQPQVARDLVQSPDVVGNHHALDAGT